MKLVRLASVALLCAIALGARADYPERPISVVVPFAPGGSTDVMSRVIAAGLERDLGQPVVIENRAGAGGMIGAAAVARAKPDGYTLLITGGMSLFPIFNKEVPFDPGRDFTPIAMTHAVPFFLAVRREVPVQDFAALVAYAKANPGRLNYGLGSASYEKLYFEMLRQRAGLDMTEVLYKGGAPLYQALVVNEVQVALGALGPLRTTVGEDKLRLIAVTTEARYPETPSVPTFTELGHPGVKSSGIGLFGPGGLAGSSVQKLNAAVTRAKTSPAVREAAAKYGIVVDQRSTPADAARQLAEEVETLSAVAKAGRIVPGAP